MDNRNYNDNEYEYDWDTRYYGTGPTEPPKERSGTMSLMLILIIFLFGIIAVLGILNIRLFQELKSRRQEPQLSISFTTEATLPPETVPQEPVRQVSLCVIKKPAQGLLCYPTRMKIRFFISDSGHRPKTVPVWHIS